MNYSLTSPTNANNILSWWISITNDTIEIYNDRWNRAGQQYTVTVRVEEDGYADNYDEVSFDIGF